MKKKKQPEKIERIDIGLRLLPVHAELVARAAEIEAQHKGVTVSRNGFCAAAVIAAARKTIADGS
jgi:uncharacterized protein (DUF1778 family)